MPSKFCNRIPRSEALVYNSYIFFLRTAVLRKLYEIRFSFKHCNFSRFCLPVKTASKTVITTIKKPYKQKRTSAQVSECFYNLKLRNVYTTLSQYYLQENKNSAINNLIHGFFVISVGTGQLHFQILYVLFEVSNLRKARIGLQQVKMRRN